MHSGSDLHHGKHYNKPIHKIYVSAVDMQNIGQWHCTTWLLHDGMHAVCVLQFH